MLRKLELCILKSSFYPDLMKQTKLLEYFLDGNDPWRYSILSDLNFLCLTLGTLTQLFKQSCDAKYQKNGNQTDLIAVLFRTEICDIRETDLA